MTAAQSAKAQGEGPGHYNDSLHPETTRTSEKTDDQLESESIASALGGPVSPSLDHQDQLDDLEKAVTRASRSRLSTSNSSRNRGGLDRT